MGKTVGSHISKVGHMLSCLQSRFSY